MSKKLIEQLHPVGFATQAKRIEELEHEVAELKAENESLLKNLRGKHALTGATYAHLIKKRDQLREQVTLLREVMNRIAFSRVGTCENIALELFDREAWAIEALAATEPKP